jgi:hypothetical protein
MKGKNNEPATVLVVRPFQHYYLRGCSIFASLLLLPILLLLLLLLLGISSSSSTPSLLVSSFQPQYLVLPRGHHRHRHHPTITGNTATGATKTNKHVMMLLHASSPPPSSTHRNKNNNKNNNPDAALTNAAPLYITVGPQCCGKTTILQNKLQQSQSQQQQQQQSQQQLVDISLDDQPDVYVPIPTSIFLNPDATTSSQQQQQLLQQKMYHGKSLLERIQDEASTTELRWILKRWEGEVSPQNFAIAMLQFYRDQGHPVPVSQALIRAVEGFLKVVPVVVVVVGEEEQQESKSKKATRPSSLPIMPTVIQVFVVESLFRPHPQSSLSAIQRAHKQLRETPLHTPVAWGNTNSKSKDYQMALEIACQTRRPVHFIVCAPPLLPAPAPSVVDGTTTNDTTSSMSQETALQTKTRTTTRMPWVPLSTLLLRNLQRLADSGKYVPAVAIADCCMRVEALVAPYYKNSNSNSNHNNINNDQEIMVEEGGNGTTMMDVDGGTTMMDVDGGATMMDVDGDDNDERKNHSNNSRLSSLEEYLVQLAEPRSPRGTAPAYRYRLTRNRLIQKEFLDSSSAASSNRHRPRNGGDSSSPGRNSNEGYGNRRQQQQLPPLPPSTPRSWDNNNNNRSRGPPRGDGGRPRPRDGQRTFPPSLGRESGGRDGRRQWSNGDDQDDSYYGGSSLPQNRYGGDDRGPSTRTDQHVGSSNTGNNKRAWERGNNNSNSNSNTPTGRDEEQGPGRPRQPHQKRPRTNQQPPPPPLARPSNR